MKNFNVPKLVECCESRTKRNFSFAADYAEPGYSTPEKGIVFGNWNPKCGFGVSKAEQKRDPVSKLAHVLEANGFELEWDDEWTTCDDCHKAIRISGDSYGWTPHFRWVGECYTICLDCLDPADYLESIEDDSRNACPPKWNPEDYGYVKFNGNFETGFHPGQNDDPAKILEKMHAQGMRKVVFKIAGVGQFDCTWQAFYKPETASE